ncbi:hypothetical protein ILUMI_02919 [Ignelater luminosus]|uniref:Nucleolar protein 14 n=1 Tax=Ignelater luminosus TaxID=2038154 RepID=A0A8K0GG13_IGNLU|nr:hypothetical protein ILUMI_02919 [Ignelater luminosus]
MAKIKNKKKNLAEHINSKKKSANVKTLNPFEVHINKEKMRVLGKKLKNDRGLPGVSRAKAIKKRKNTLLQEFKLQNKSNKFLDKRIGERNAGLTEEDRAMARFTAVRAKAHKRKSIFNLADDEVLTHRGQTLNEIEKFDDPRSDDEDSLDGEVNSGKLDSNFVEDAHFGGGVLSKTGIEGAKSHKDLINQLIAESKRRKAEKQKTKEKTLELTEKLDSDWKDLIPIVNKSVRQPNESSKIEVDDYDKVMRELKFEARGHPSDRLKTEDEIAKEEKEKLENLEKERLDRMRGFVEDKKSTSVKHRSADDLDDDFAYDSDTDVMLSYNDQGESNIVLTGDKINDENEDDHQNESADEEESDEEIETASEDDLSDLKEESSDSEVEDEKPNKQDKEEKEVSQLESSKTQKTDLHKRCLERIDDKVKDSKKQKTEDSSHNGTTEDIKADLLKRKEMMEKARKELPYTFSLPQTYEEVQNVFKDQSPEHQSVIIERMIKCNHPSLGENNKEKLGMLFVYLLQYINDIASDNDIKNCFKILSCIIPQLFDLSQLNQENAHKSIVEVIKEKHLEYRRNKKVYPTLEVVLFLKIVSCLFTTSDFRHQIVTPCIVFIDQMLYKCKPKTEKDIAYGLFLVTLILEYTSLSKRYLPAAVSFLAGILHMTIPKSGVRLIKVLPPFRSTSSALVLYKNCSSVCMSLKLEISDLTEIEISEDFKIRALYTTLKLLQEFKLIFSDYSSRCEIFENVTHYLEQIPVSNYPIEVQNEMKKLSDSLEKTKQERKLDYIVMEAKKPKALRLYEPNIQKVFDTKKHKVTSREKAERDKLLHKLKRERKGALREIRRDKEFLGRIRIKQKIQSDMERKEKVKQIFSEASIQQSELNSLDRKKKRKK